MLFLEVLFRLARRRFASSRLLLLSVHRKEVELRLDFTPSDVWVHPSAQGVSIKIIPGGFVLTASPDSDNREIQWVAVK
jgi:hypothetical protein